MSNFVPQTEIVLCNHVPFDRSYNTSVLFDTKEEQQAFFRTRKVLEIPKNTYQRMSLTSFKVQAKADDLREQGVNYCYWKNGNYSNKYYYAFVTSIEYVNPNTAIIYYELDDIQTYMFDITYMDSYIERKHYDLGTRDSEGNLTKFTCPMEEENLNYGNQYNIIKRDNLTQIPNVSFIIIGTTNIGGTMQVREVPTCLGYYILPLYVGTKDELYQQKTFKLKVDNNTYELSNAKGFLEYFRTNEDLVGTIVSTYITPFLPCSDLTYSVEGDTIIFSSKYLGVITHPIYNFKYLQLSSVYWGFDYYDFTDINNTLSEYPKFSEQKLYMSPYSLNVLSTDRGNSFIAKNEYLLDNKLSVRMYGTLSIANKQMFLLKNYASEGIYIDNGIIDESNASMPIIDDYTASYIQSNKNSIEVARANALSSYQTNVTNSTNTYRGSMQQIALQRQQANNTSETATTNAKAQMYSTMAQSAVSAVLGVASTDMGGNLGKSASQAIQGYTTYANTNLEIATNYANAMLSATSNEIGSAVSMQNANNTANTDYQNTIATLNAKYEDASAVADTVRSLGNDFVFNVVSMHDGIYLYHKRILDEYVIKLTNYFKMYGYLANEMGSIQENIKSRTKYNYIKLIQCNITGEMPQDKIMAIKNIFMNGITFFHELTAVSGEETNLVTAYTNIARNYEMCMYDYETNVPTPSTHTITFSYIDDNGTLTTDVTSEENPNYVSVTDGNKVTIKLKAKEGYKVYGIYSRRLGLYYEGDTITLPIYHDETFVPQYEQDV